MADTPSQQDIDRSLREFSESLETQNTVIAVVDIAAPRGFRMTNRERFVCRNVPKDICTSAERSEQIAYVIHTIAKDHLDFSDSYTVVKDVKVVGFNDSYDSTNIEVEIQLKRSLLLFATGLIEF